MSNELDNAYLDYYNLDNEDEEAVKEFLERYSIEGPIIIDGKPLTIESLIYTERYFFRETFDYLRKHKAKAIDIAEKSAQQLNGKSALYPPGSPGSSPPFEVVLRTQSHLRRTQPMLLDVEHKAGYLWRDFWCEDFLALVYLQLWMLINSEAIHRLRRCQAPKTQKTPACQNIFIPQPKGKEQRYCSKKCANRARRLKYYSKTGK